MRASRVTLPCWLAALCAAGWPAAGAWAEPVSATANARAAAAGDDGEGEDSDHARARVLSGEAMIAYRAADFEHALERFQAAYELVPAPELLFNIGQCYRQLQRHEAAKAVFHAYLEALPQAAERAQIERWIAASDRQHALAPGAATLPAPASPARTPPARDRALTVQQRGSVRDSAGEDDAEVYERWWFWTALGVVAVGGGVTAALLLDAGDDGGAAPAGSLGTVRWP